MTVSCGFISLCYLQESVSQRLSFLKYELIRVICVSAFTPKYIQTGRLYLLNSNIVGTA